MLPLAALVGGIIGGPLLEALGRKTTIICTAIPFLAAGLLVTFAQDVYTIYAGRGHSGFLPRFLFRGLKTCRVKIVSRKNDILLDIVQNCSSKMINTYQPWPFDSVLFFEHQ